MKISFDKNRFLVECNFAENALVAPIPTKRFNSRTRSWHVPNVRKNCEYMLDNLRVHMDEQAAQMADLTIKKASVKYLPFPSEYAFKTQPYQHQREALDFAYGLDRLAFFMEMGTGKTKTSIDLFSAHMLDGKFSTWVVFCPNAVRRSWMNEIRIHSPIDVEVVIVESGKTLILGGTKPCVIVVGLESLSGKFRGGTAFDSLINLIGGKKYGVTVDESHLCKNPDANRSKNVDLITKGAVVANVMTGTPVTQGLLDLYMQFEILNPDILGFGSYFAFRSRYAVMGGYENREVVGYQNQDELMRAIKPFSFFCRKEDVLDLPPKVYSARHVEMSPEQSKAFKEINKEMETIINNKGQDVEVFVDQVLAKYTILQQISGGFLNHKDIDGVRHTTHLVEPEKNPKIRELLEILEQNPDRSVIVWAKFRQEIHDITQVLKKRKITCCEYHGGVSDAERNENMLRFNSGEFRVFVSNQQTGGTGLTLNRADLVVYFSNSLKLSERLQSEDRNHRIGQSKSVLYIDLIAEKSRDLEIVNILKNKMDIAEYVRSSF